MILPTELSESIVAPDISFKLLPLEEPNVLERRILQTVSYADVFDFPLRAGEIHQNLVGLAVSSLEVQAALDRSYLLCRYLERNQTYYTLLGRANIIEERRQRSLASSKLWPLAVRYGHLIAHIPFVKMVALTGALAVHNAKPGDDVDYLIITEPGRLWLSRSMVILLVKVAARRGIELCPNYFLSERLLALTEQNLFTAHELVQMVPLAGPETYRQMIDANSWAEIFLPNAYPAINSAKAPMANSSFLLRPLEMALRTRPGYWLERWEMERKINKFSRQHSLSLSPKQTSKLRPIDHAEVVFSADQCKGHFNHHGSRTLQTYSAQLMQFLKEE
jgi:hypothetical protein